MLNAGALRGRVAALVVPLWLLYSCGLADTLTGPEAWTDLLRALRGA